MKRTLCILLSLVLTLTGLVGLCVPASAVNVGDIITFGNYPQTQVSETTALKNAANATTWNSYGYYIGTGNIDGNMTASDYMKYADFVSDDVKYRAVKFSKYRPYDTYKTSSADNSNQDDKGYFPNTTYYFRYEPLSWRVLDPSTGLILCEKIIDSQAYQNIVRQISNGNVYIGTTSTFANNYEHSTIRTWLNNDFFNTAFNSAQRADIKNSTINNDAYSVSNAQYNSAPTTDKIYLLSYSEAQSSSYGLSSDSARRANYTDYAKCQGLDAFNSGFSYWTLRSAGNVPEASCSVYSTGVFDTYNHVYSTSCGIRPACILSKLAAETYTVTATADPTAGGTVTGGGTYAEGTTATLTATANSGYMFSGWYNGSTKVSSNKSYTFTVTGNVTLTAKFGKLSMGYTVTATADPAAGGTVTGGGTYSNGQSATVTATPNNGYLFSGWHNGSTWVSYNKSYTFTVTGNVTLTAKFGKKMNYTVTATANPTAGGTVNGGGTYYAGQTATVTATPNSGWKFTGWFDGNNQVSSSTSYSFTVTGNVTLTAKFEKDNPTKNAKLNVPASATVGYKAKVAVNATADNVPSGYFVALYEGDTKLAKGDNKTVSYTMTKMKAGKTLTAKIIDANGNVQSNADGKLEKEIKITVKTGFFDKVKAFFLGLFGLLPQITLNP